MRETATAPTQEVRRGKGGGQAGDSSQSAVVAVAGVLGPTPVELQRHGVHGRKSELPRPRSPPPRARRLAWAREGGGGHGSDSSLAAWGEKKKQFLPANCSSSVSGEEGRSNSLV
jgi:hypothetical protein